LRAQIDLLLRLAQPNIRQQLVGVGKILSPSRIEREKNGGDESSLFRSPCAFILAPRRGD